MKTDTVINNGKLDEKLKIKSKIKDSIKEKNVI